MQAAILIAVTDSTVRQIAGDVVVEKEHSSTRLRLPVLLSMALERSRRWGEISSSEILLYPSTGRRL